MSTIPATFVMAMASFHASMHALRILANHGLVSPAELDKSLDGVVETIEHLPPEHLELFLKNFDPMMVQMKQAAAQNWQKKND